MLGSLLSEVFVPRVLGRIDAHAGLLIDPVVADDAMLVGMRARQQGRVADARISRCVAVVIVAVPGAAVEKGPEAALAVLVVILDQLFLREAVDHHKQDELGRRLSAWCARGLGKRTVWQKRETE